MIEYIKTNDNLYPVVSISSGYNSISFSTNMSLQEAKEVFKDTKKLEITDSPDNKGYGLYNHVEFKSVTELEDGLIKVCFYIPSSMELAIKELTNRCSELENLQKEQDSLIIELFESLLSEDFPDDLEDEEDSEDEEVLDDTESGDDDSKDEDSSESSWYVK